MSALNKSQRKVCAPKTNANHSSRNPNRKASAAANSVRRCGGAYGCHSMSVGIPAKARQPAG